MRRHVTHPVGGAPPTPAPALPLSSAGGPHEAIFASWEQRLATDFQAPPRSLGSGVGVFRSATQAGEHRRPRGEPGAPVESAEKAWPSVAASQQGFIAIRVHVCVCDA